MPSIFHKGLHCAAVAQYCGTGPDRTLPRCSAASLPRRWHFSCLKMHVSYAQNQSRYLPLDLYLGPVGRRTGRTPCVNGPCTGCTAARLKKAASASRSPAQAGTGCLVEPRTHHLHGAHGPLAPLQAMRRHGTVAARPQPSAQAQGGTRCARRAVQWPCRSGDNGPCPPGFALPGLALRLFCFAFFTRFFLPSFSPYPRHDFSPSSDRTHSRPCQPAAHCRGHHFQHHVGTGGRVRRGQPGAGFSRL